ncbi:diguanylate cyclase domain-containing protein [Burkholderia ubonensis]|uniref:diguanylate cyclase domain-containing protein n=1 Tax=Burkholderia ubonensis TaxID=101571 RepID=UPI0009B4D094|nr:diguanylate cyclase [Burkholderia ubonensis]
MEMTSSEAKAALEQLIEETNWLFLSPREVTCRLDEIAAALFARRLRVQIDQLGQKYFWGALGDDAPSLVLQKGDLSADVQFTVFGDCFPETAEEQEILPRLKVLAKALWGEDMRPAGGLAWKRESVRVRLPKSVERLRELSPDRGSIAILFADLDKFKNLNDQAGHEKGDEAIRMVNRELHDLCLHHGGLPFHPSGDEYYLILPDVGLLPMMKALYDLRQRIQQHAFRGDDGRSHNIDLTLGMQFLHDDVTFERIKQTIDQAEEATKSPLVDGENITSAAESNSESRDKEKRRGRLSIASVVGVSGVSTTACSFAHFGTVLIRRRACLSRPTFPDPRLGMIELVAQNHKVGGAATLDEAIEHLTQWLDIQTTPTCSMGSLLQEQPAQVVPQIALAIAVASGILRAQYTADQTLPNDLRVAFTSDGARAQVLVDGNVKWGGSLEGCEGVEQAEILTPKRERKSAPLIGLQVGLSDRPAFEGKEILPLDIFSHVVVIDDRPNSGGGLPDFWQVAVAQVCQSAARGTDTLYIFGWGRACDNSETVRRLKQEVGWNIDEVASLADISSDTVRVLMPMLKQNLKIVKTAEELVESLYENAPVEVAEEFHQAGEANPTLDVLARKMLESQALESIDGVRCRTAAQAYPVIIDVLRRAATRRSADDAFQTLRELIAFKLVLEAPQQDAIPAYLRSQGDDMARYASEVLIGPQSRIGEILEKDNQVEVFRRELASCYNAGSEHRSTRRALLVVPHKPKPDGSPSPEGLVSIWASPRVGDVTEGNIVDWVFVWRTVEAFIGLPYSLYGSIQLAQSLLANGTSEETSSLPQLRMGQLTYVALSLHMRVDGVHRRIAKRIVDLSSD